MSEHGDNLVELTVSELSGQVKRLVEDSFGRVRVRGELGRVSRPASGHVYFDVKDDKAVLSGVMWKGTAQKLTMQRSVERAVAYVDRAIRMAPGFGQGHGPINHAHPLERADAQDDWFDGDEDHD